MKRVGSILFAAALIAGSGYAQAEPQNHLTTTETTQTTTHSMKHAGADHDRMFADTMSKHHRDGIRMSEMAVEKAQSAELRAMAQKMINDQTREIDQMENLRGDGPATSMDMMMQMPGMMSESQMRSDMERLENARGEQFDLAFTEIMAKHHQSGVMMAQHEIENGSSDGMKNIARHIADHQSSEREKLLAMHRDLSDDEPAAMTSATTERQRLSKD